MIGRLFLFGLCAATFAQESSIDIKSDLETLKKLTDDGERRVQQTVALIDAAPEEFKKLSEERIGCLTWVVTTQKAETNKTIAEAIFKGLLKNKKFANFQCVSTASQETLEKLGAVEPEIPAMSTAIREKGLVTVRAFGRIMPAFSGYCRDIYKQKSQDLNKATNQDGRAKIIKEVVDKMKLLSGILKEVEDFLGRAKFKFLEEHVDFAHRLETSIRRFQREGAQKILKCVN